MGPPISVESSTDHQSSRSDVKHWMGQNLASCKDYCPDAILVPTHSRDNNYAHSIKHRISLYIHACMHEHTHTRTHIHTGYVGTPRRHLHFSWHVRRWEVSHCENTTTIGLSAVHIRIATILQLDWLHTALLFYYEPVFFITNHNQSTMLHQQQL